jgi:LAO/AO transport system ATPase
MADLGTLLERFRRGDRLALSRLLSLLARGEEARAILSAVPTAPGTARVVAVTGSAGVGKSTLVGRLIERVRRDGVKVAVLACDPQSPRSGGALLGDRFRMTAAPDDGVFIRSLAALSGRGAVAEHLPDLVRLLAAFGFDLVLIETVGAGQGDVAVSRLADTVVLLLQPETGDDLQWEKAGVLEVADIIVVQKADLPRAEQVAAQVRSTLDLAGTSHTPVLLVSAKAGTGIDELWQAIRTHTPRDVGADAAHPLLQAALDLLTERFEALRARDDPALASLVSDWRRGGSSEADTANELLHLLERLS